MPSFALKLALLTGLSTVGLAAMCQHPSMEKYGVSEMVAESRRLPDLRFPQTPTTLESSTNLSNTLIAPDTKIDDTKYPGIVLMHRCSGIQEREMRYWVEAAIQRRYVVLVVDSLRGNRTNCAFPLAIESGRRLKDAFDALQHLSALPFVDTTKIYAVGFSQGGFIASLLSSKEVASAFASPNERRFTKAASFYGHCKYPIGSIPGVAYSIDIVRPDTDRPLLLLMGELDNETPPSTCDEILRSLQAKGAPVASHVFPGTTHCWDCLTRDGATRTDFRGTKVTYRFDRSVTESSLVRLFDFFSK
jgi:dienelactone hydrolase